MPWTTLTQVWYLAIAFVARDITFYISGGTSQLDELLIPGERYPKVPPGKVVS